MALSPRSPMDADMIERAGGATKVAVGQMSRVVDIPDELGWDQTAFPLEISLRSIEGGQKIGECSLDPFESDEYAACLAGAQIYVSNTGSDSTGDGSSGAPYRGLNKAIQIGNATGAPFAIHFPGATYLGRTNSQFSATYPTQDVAFIAEGGRITMSVYDPLTWTADSTYPWVYKATRSQALRMVDPSRRNEYGLYPDYKLAASVAECSRNPGTWYSDGTTVYANPVGGGAVSNTNARLYLSVPLWNFTYTAAAAVNVFIKGATANDGFDFEGGVTGGITITGPSTEETYKKVFAVDGATFRYGSGAGQSSDNCFTVNRWPGLLYLNGCDAGAGWTDSFNLHNSVAANDMYVLFVNCSGADTGRGGNGATSTNNLTGHDDMLHVIDVAGDYSAARGYSVHFIGTSKVLCIGTRSRDSLGDIVNGGLFGPGEFRVADSAEMWLDGAEASPRSTVDEALTATGTSAIHTRNMHVVRGRQLATSGSVIDSY